MGDFKNHFMVTTKYISVSKKSIKLLLTVRIILCSKNQNYYENLNKKHYLCQTTIFYFYILRNFSKNMGNMHSNYSYFYMLMIKICNSLFGGSPFSQFYTLFEFLLYAKYFASFRKFYC